MVDEIYEFTLWGIAYSFGRKSKGYTMMTSIFYQNAYTYVINNAA